MSFDFQNRPLATGTAVPFLIAIFGSIRPRHITTCDTVLLAACHVMNVLEPQSKPLGLMHCSGRFR